MSSMPAIMLPESLMQRRFVFLGSPIDPLTMEETLALAETAMRERKRLQHVVVNVAKLVHMQNDAELREDVSGSDLINIDGMGVVWGACFCGHNVPERVAGVDLMENLLALCAEKGFKPYILGAKQPVLEQAVRNIQANHPAIQFAGYRNGYFTAEEEAALVQDIATSGADCLFIAMTTPHKERLLKKYKDAFNVPFLMGVGGSVDVIAGHVNRAPKWMQNAGLEWFYRIVQEPRRMWKRYLNTNSKFAWLLLKERLGLGRS